MKIEKVDFALALTVAVLATPVAQGQGISAATHGQRLPGLTMETSELVEPIQLFDNLYYIGTTFVSAFFIVTSDGFIMIDALHDDHTGRSLQQLRDIGLDTTDIRYLIVSHGHRDHFDGAAMVRAHSNAIVAMNEADWKMYEESDVPRIPRDMIIEDEDLLTLGDTTLRFYQTPGHTLGVSSFEFLAYDDGEPHRVFFHAGHNVTGADPQAFRAFIDSTKRLQNILTDIDVNLTSHPWASLIFERAGMLAERQPSEPHPFVQPGDFIAFLTERIESHEARLAEL